jgi:hypothetical protein
MTEENRLPSHEDSWEKVSSFLTSVAFHQAVTSSGLSRSGEWGPDCQESGRSFGHLTSTTQLGWSIQADLILSGVTPELY